MHAQRHPQSRYARHHVPRATSLRARDRRRGAQGGSATPGTRGNGPPRVPAALAWRSVTADRDDAELARYQAAFARDWTALERVP
jgi:hypothetical protein